MLKTITQCFECNWHDDCVCFPQSTVQGSSWTVSTVDSTISSTCCLTAVNQLPISAVPTTNRSTLQRMLHPAATMTPTWTWTAVCSLAVMMLVTVWSSRWRFLSYAITSRRAAIILVRNWLDYQRSVSRLSHVTNQKWRIQSMHVLKCVGRGGIREIVWFMFKWCRRGRIGKLSWDDMMYM